MNAPILRFKEFNDEWKTYSIGEITESLKSGLSRMLQHQDIGIPVIRANNIENGNLNFNDLKYWYVDDPQGANTSNYFVRKNDILINFINSEAKMGTAAIVTEEPFREMIYTTNILKLNTNRLADNYYFYLYTDSKKYKDYIKLITKPAVNQASFTTVDFKKHKITLPSVNEQTKIAQFFKSLNHKILLQQEKIALLKEQKKSYMQKIFSQDLRFKDENGQEFPKWDKVKLGKVTRKTGKKNSKGTKYPVAAISNKKGFTLEGDRNYSNVNVDIKAYKLVQRDEFAYNPARINVGSFGFQNVTDTAIVSSLYVVFKTLPELLQQYLKAYMYSHYFNRDVIRNTEGSVREYLFYENFANIKIPLPCVAEQKKIAEFLTKLDSKILLEDQYLKHLNSQKKFFMQQMFI